MVLTALALISTIEAAPALQNRGYNRLAVRAAKVDCTAPSNPNSCDWAGHCYGTACKTDDDCSDPYVCISGVCSIEGCPAAPLASGSTTSSTIKSTSTTSSSSLRTSSTSTTSARSVTTPTPYQSGMTTNCGTFYMVVSGDTCSTITSKYGITLANFYAWNTGVNSNTCSNLVVNNYYCVGLAGTSSTAAPTTSVSKTTSTSASPSSFSTSALSKTTSTSSTLSSTTLSSSSSSKSTSTSSSTSATSTIYTASSTLTSSTSTLSVTSSKITSQSYSTISPTTTSPTTSSSSSSSFKTTSSTSIASPVISTASTSTSTSSTITLTSLKTTSTSSSSTLTTTISSAITTPTPIQSGMTTSCKAFYQVQSGDTCSPIAAKYSIAVSDFISWNPAIGSSCNNLQIGYYVCVSITSSTSTAMTTTKASAIATSSSSATTTIATTTRTAIGPSVTNATGLSWYSSSLSSGTSGQSNPSSYTCMYGSASNFPAMSSWISFNAMWTLNQQTSLNAWPADTSTAQQILYNAILQVASDSQVDARFILATIMQESTGNLAVPCTNNGVQNCGIMQAYAGSITYDSNNMQSSILQMVRDGTQGPVQSNGQNAGGLVQIFNQANSYGNIYNTARLYNSGSANYNDLNNAMGATASYVNDIANRLLGWNGNGSGFSGCPATASSSTTASGSTSTAASSASTPSPIQSGMTTSCTKFYQIKSGDTCSPIAASYNVAVSDLYNWNPAIGSSCTNLQIGYYVCVGTSGTSSSSGSSSTTTSRSGSTTASPASTPSPIQSGMTTSCTTFYQIKSGDTCSPIAASYNVAVSDLYNWNPAIGSSCTNLQIGYYVCVGVSGTSSSTSSGGSSSSSSSSSSSTWNTITGSIYSTDSSCQNVEWTAGSCGLSTYFSSQYPSSTTMPYIAMSASVMGGHGSSQNNAYCGKVINILAPNGVTRQAVISDTAGNNIIDMCPELWTAFGHTTADATQFQVQWQFA